MLSSNDVVRIGTSTQYCFPFTGKFKVTSPFGPRSLQETWASKNHKGVDLVALENKTIVSVANGVVKRAQYQKGYGNYVWVANEDGKGCIYAHMAETYVKVGQKVHPKTPIGLMGSTGHSTGPHLHFGVSTSTDYSTTHTKDNYWINPFAYLGVSPYDQSIKGKTYNGGQPLQGGVAVSAYSQDNTSYSSGISSSTNIVQSGEYYEVVDIQGTLSDWLYGRNYRVIVSLEDGEAFDVSEVRCTFDIEKTQFKQGDKASIVLYNLSPDTENKIIRSGSRVIVEAGYNGNFYGIIFVGTIIQPIRSKSDGVDYMLTLICRSTDRFLTYGLINTTVAAEQSSRDVIDAIASRANYPVETGSIADTRFSYPRGKVMFGKPSDYLDSLAKTVNATYYTEDGKVNIVQAKSLPSDEIFDLGPKTGLINSPSQNETGITFECLLNPLITINSLVRIDNKKIAGFKWEQGKAIRSLDAEGIYRIITVKYSGDTRGDNWKCECSAITQAGTLPSFLANPNLYGW